MVLSDGDKARIRAEEEEREKVKEEIKKRPPKISKGCAIAFGIFLMVIIGGFVTCMIGVSGTKPTPDLKASVRFDGTQFHITNNDVFDWLDVKIKVNSEYKLATAIMQSGKEYSVGAMQFAKDDGTRFNPFTNKAIDLMISCTTPEGKHASYIGGWK